MLYSRLQLPFWLELVRALPGPMVLLILAGGMIFLLYGHTVFKLEVIVNSALGAGYIGWRVGLHVNHPELIAAGCAIIFAILAWPMFAVCVAGFMGLIGSALAVSVVMLLPGQHHQYVPYAAGVGFIAFTIIGWFLFDPAVMAFTAFQGAVMVVLSGMTLLDTFLSRIWSIRGWPGNHGLVVAAIILALTVTGIVYQGKTRGGRVEGPGREVRQTDR